MDTPEIKIGDFLYRDTLFVDLGSNKRHPRASPQDLKVLLLPKSGTAPKDQVAHWYEAQLIHYGLPRSKDKNTAKVRLTNAITAKTLAVPKEVTKMEAEMKKQYATALRKAKSPAGKAALGPKTKEFKSKSSKTTVELEIDGIKLKIDREALKSAKTPVKAKPDISKQKGAKASSAKPLNVATIPPTKSPAPPKPRAAKVSNPKAAIGREISRPMPKQTARRSKPFQYGANSRPTAGPSKVVDHTPHSFREDVDMDDAPPAYESHNFDGHEEPTTRRPGHVQISGTYHFPNPSVRPFELTLQIDQKTQTLWGRFQIDNMQGVVHMGDISRITSGDPITFGWRSENQDSGKMRFGRGCDGTMAFNGEDWVEGRFRGLLFGEDVEFEGNLIDEDGLDVREAQQYWDDFPRKAYGRD
jgi:hypothetical protein